MLNDFWGHIDDIAIRYALEQTTQIEYDAKGKVTLALVKMSIGGNLIENVQDAMVAKKAWDSIATIYEHKNNAKTLMLRNQLYSLNMCVLLLTTY